MAFAIKAEVRDPRAKTFAFAGQKTMYGGKRIAVGDMIFVFASENEGGHGLIAKGVVTHAEVVAGKRGVAYQRGQVWLRATVRKTHHVAASTSPTQRVPTCRNLPNCLIVLRSRSFRRFKQCPLNRLRN